jgi:hypothetical protein
MFKSTGCIYLTVILLALSLFYFLQKPMGHFKTFLLGMGVAYGIYYITKKREDGTSIMDDLLDNPSDFMDRAKNIATDELARTVKKIIT